MRARRSACRSRPASSRTRRFLPASFDVVTMYHALEHVEDPLRHPVAASRRGWSSGGVLLIEVPNVEAVCIAPAHRFHFAHFYNFNRDDARGARAESGLRAGADDDVAGWRKSDRACSGQSVRAQPPRLDAANYARVAGVVKGHTLLRYYCSASPYAGPLSRLRTYLTDRTRARGAKRPGRYSTG